MATSNSRKQKTGNFEARLAKLESLVLDEQAKREARRQKMLETNREREKKREMFDDLRKKALAEQYPNWDILDTFYLHDYRKLKASVKKYEKRFRNHFIKAVHDFCWSTYLSYDRMEQTSFSYLILGMPRCRNEKCPNCGGSGFIQIENAQLELNVLENGFAHRN